MSEPTTRGEWQRERGAGEHFHADQLDDVDQLWCGEERHMSRIAALTASLRTDDDNLASRSDDREIAAQQVDGVCPGQMLEHMCDEE